MKYKAAVLTVSDKCSRGERVDTSGPALCAMLEQAGFELIVTGVMPDERDQISAEIRTGSIGRANRSRASRTGISAQTSRTDAAGIRT